MKISKLGTALTLAALAAAGTRPASAQLDMTGAAGALSSIQALKAQAAKSPKPGAKKPAGVPAPTADDAAWQKIVEAVKAKGKYTPEQPPLKPGSFTLEDVVGDPKGDHTVDKVTAVGMINEDELFETLGFMIASQSWKLGADGNWTLDSWVFETTVYGELEGVAHVVAVLDPAKEPVSGGPEKITPADPRIVPKYKSVIDHWSAPRP